MENWDDRTTLLLGEEKVRLLASSHVLVVGLGGVGAYLAESLCRAGIGQLTIADGDVVRPSNRNRQLLALSSTHNIHKTSLLASRLHDINPMLRLREVNVYLRDDEMREWIFQPYDYVADAIDTLSPKLFLLADAVKYGHRVVSSMGAGGRLDPARIRVADISETHTCPLALLLRKRLRRQGVYQGIKAVFSEEPVIEGALLPVQNEPNKKTTVGTISYMPAMFGLYMASVILRDLIDT
jgi:tRNA A37 threonylcarbamoyladenosine dehydratase